MNLPIYLWQTSKGPFIDFYSGVASAFIYFWNDATEAQIAIVQAGLTTLTTIVVPAAVWLFKRSQIKEIEARENDTNREILEKVDTDTDAVGSNTTNDGQQPSNRGQLKNAWSSIKNELIAIATSKGIDGRTRAKYARLDYRKGYDKLIQQLRDDGQITAEVAKKFEDASELWSKHRANRAQISDDDVTEMIELSYNLAKGRASKT